MPARRRRSVEIGDAVAPGEIVAEAAQASSVAGRSRV
jgi:hypothetical protein